MNRDSAGDFTGFAQPTHTTLRAQSGRRRLRGPSERAAPADGSIIAALAEKLSTARAGVTPTPARGLDLKEVALAIGDEQSTTTELLQAIHASVRLIACEAGPGGVSAAVPEAGLMADENLSGTEWVSVGAARRRVGDPPPDRRLHQVAAVSACPVDS